MSSIYNESDTDLVDAPPISKFRTKFVDKKLQAMQKNRYEKMVTQKLAEDQKQEAALARRARMEGMDELKDLSVDLH